MEHEIDTLPYDTPHSEGKVQDLNSRLDRAYDELIQIEQKIDDLLFDHISEEDKKKTIAYLIKEVEVHKAPEGKNLSRLKSITFNFPVYYSGSDTDQFLWDKSTHVSTCLE